MIGHKYNYVIHPDHASISCEKEGKLERNKVRKRDLTMVTFFFWELQKYFILGDMRDPIN